MTTSHCQRQSIGGLVKMDRQRWWEHLLRIFCEQLSKIEILRKRIAAGTATFLVTVKPHPRKPANEGADILADKAISDPKVGKEWCQRTNQVVFRWKKPCHEAGKVNCQDLHSTYNNRMRDAL